MTLQIERRSKTHQGNGLTTVFPYDFPIPNAGSVRVYLFNEENNARTDLSSAQYHITGLGEDDFGYVEYPISGTPLPPTSTITIAREVPYTQELDIHNQGGFYPEVLEHQLDLIVMQIQQAVAEGQGALRAQLGETFNELPPKESLKGKFLAFDGLGEPYGAQVITLGMAVFSTEGEARQGISDNTIMSPLRVFQAIEERTRYVFPEDFIELAGGNETIGLQQFFSTLAAEGGIGRLSRWYNVTAAIVISSSAQAFVVEGAGKYVSGLRRVSAPGFTVLDIICDDFVLRDFGIDGGRTTNPSSGAGGLRVKGSRWQTSNIHVRDYSGVGIAGVAPAGEVESLCTVQNCHVDGTGAASQGISLTSYVDSGVDGCLVENVFNALENAGILLAGCSNTAIANSRARNCFVSVSVAAGPEGNGSNNQVSDLLITSPNPSSPSGAFAIGVRLDAGSALSCSGMSIDGGNLAGFIGVQVDNAPDGGASVTFRASNCAGAGSYVLRLAGASYSLVDIASVFNVNDKFVHITGAGGSNTVLLGRKEGAPIYAPWRHVQDDVHAITNLVQMLSGDFTQYLVLADDEAVFLPVVDGVIGLLEVSTGGAGEWFMGSANFSATPLIQGTVGADCATGTSALATGASGGVDNKLNVHVTLDRLYIKNRTGGSRNLIFRLVMA